jgi:peptide/nickel transport system substrate-binding protein
VPLKGQWVPEDLQWAGRATLPFFGTDGTLDPEAARDAFLEAGYQYEDDKLIRREGT